jgi:hypothetical protein
VPYPRPEQQEPSHAPDRVTVVVYRLAKATAQALQVKPDALLREGLVATGVPDVE